MVRLTSGKTDGSEEDTEDEDCNVSCLRMGTRVAAPVIAPISAAQRAMQPHWDPRRRGSGVESPMAGRGHSPATQTIKQKKKLLDVIYGFHALCALVTGLVAIAYPQIFEVFMNVDEQPGGCVRISDQAHTIIQLYGALILSQSWLVWKTRELPDPFMRKIFAQGYFLCFSVSTLVLGYKASFSKEWGAFTWPVVLLFFAFSGIYAWFLLTKKLPEYDPPNAGLV